MLALEGPVAGGFDQAAEVVQIGADLRHDDVRMIALRDAAAGGAHAAGVNGKRVAVTRIVRGSRNAIETIDRLRQTNRGEAFADAFGAGKNQALREGRTLDRA